MYAPRRAVLPAPAADKTVNDVCVPPLDNFGLLIRPSPFPIVVRPPPAPPAPAPAPAPAPVPAPSAQPLSLTLPLVSDDFSADLEFARQLMLSDEENLHAAALDSLRLEDVVPARSHPGVKYAYAPSRARRAHHGQRNSGSPSSLTSSTHSSPATSSASRGFSLPLPAATPDELKPFREGPPLRVSQSHPVLSAHTHSVIPSQQVMPSQSQQTVSSQPHTVLLTQPHPLRETFSDEPVETEGVPVLHFAHVRIHRPTTESRPASPAVSATSPAAPTDTPAPPAMLLDTPPDPPLAGPSTSKRPARTTKRSPAPRRQECKTCGKKFQRPCQLTTVLSNCQRHVKLCQKRSTKVSSPGDEDAGTDSAAGPSGTNSSSFITYPDSKAPEEHVRRPNEIPIRPKVVSHGSGRGSSLLGVRPAALERSTSVGSSSVGVAEGESAGSETSTMPVVPSSSVYPYSGGSGFASASGSGSGFGYDEARPFEPPQTIYEEPGPDYTSGSAYEPAGSGFDAARSSSYDAARANSAYEPPTSAAYAGSGYDALGSSGYGASGPAYGQSGATYEQATSSGAEYSQSGPTEYGYGDYSHPSPSHVHPSPSHVHVQPLASPSHVHASSPSMYGTPSMLGTPTVHTVPLMHGGDSTFLSPTTPGPGMAVPRSMSVGNHATVPVSRRASASMTRRSTLSSMGSHDSLGFTTEPVPRRQTVVPSDPVAQPFVFQRSPAELVNRGLEPEMKHEDEGGGDAWTSAPAPAFQAGYPAVGGYPTSGVGGFHAYGPESGTTAASSAEQQQHPSSSSGYSYPEQQQAQQQQLYGQQPPGFTPQLDGEQPDGYTSGVGYTDPSSFAPESDAGAVAKLPHQHYPEYPWPGAESRWNAQPGYHS
ncbi:hypothetical protein FRC06_001754 [Ceratobasidium sp. 370]|nr:hypothetical protein FRC06_001754 [Ceratobasidium sp. 370]